MTFVRRPFDTLMGQLYMNYKQSSCFGGSPGPIFMLKRSLMTLGRQMAPWPPLGTTLQFTYYKSHFSLLVLSFTAQSNQWGQIERSQFT